MTSTNETFAAPVGVCEKDWVRYLRTRAQVRKLEGKVQSLIGRRDVLLFDVALLAGSTVHHDGAALMKYYTEVIVPKIDSPSAYYAVVGEVVRQKAEEAVELDARIAGMRVKLLAKQATLDLMLENIEAAQAE